MDIEFDFSEKQKKHLKKISKSILYFAIGTIILVFLLDYLLGSLSLNTIFRIIISLSLLFSYFIFDFFIKSIFQPNSFQKFFIYLINALLLCAWVTYLMLVPSKNFEAVIFVPFIISFLNFVTNLVGEGAIAKFYKKQKADYDLLEFKNTGSSIS